MSAKYLIRFDDVCPTMNWSVWRQVEEILENSDVKPILAVVPDNHHPELQAAEPNVLFWESVQTWQKRGWTIGLHGYQHLAATQNGGILNFNSVSEFSGLSREEQTSKLRRAVDIFQEHGVRPQVWIAPWHSFDVVTLQVLMEMGIGCLSDGFSLYPYRDESGMLWVPQQLWRNRRMPFGIWTICFHVNRWGVEEIERFRSSLLEFRPSITDWDSVVSIYGHRKRSLTDRAFSKIYPAAMKAWTRIRRK